MRERTRVHGRMPWARVRAVRHGLIATAVVLAVCAVVAGISAFSYVSASGRIAPLTARGQGVIIQSGVDGDQDTVRVRWNGQTIDVPLAATPPPAGTRVEIAYDPANPADAIVPGASVLADADAATDGIALAGALAVLVLLIGAWRITVAALARRRPVTKAVPLRRVRVQRGLITRSWLETERGDRWVPVYFDPVLVTLPTPVTARVHGDLDTDRFVAVDVPGPAGEPVTLHASGPVRRTEPRGRRADNPAEPDESAPAHAARSARLARQARADAVLLVPAPIVGLFWTFVLGTGFEGWLVTTALVAALGVWWGALRGSDPS